MVGQGILRECLLDPDVESVLAVVCKRHPLHTDFRTSNRLENSVDPDFRSKTEKIGLPSVLHKRQLC
jgi:hypothetical protein